METTFSTQAQAERMGAAEAAKLTRRGFPTVLAGTREVVVTSESRDYTMGNQAEGWQLKANSRVAWVAVLTEGVRAMNATPAYATGQRFIFTAGQPVICNGYPGRVVRPYPDAGRTEPGGMVEVRLASGVVCVSSSYPDCYPVEA